MYCSAMVGVAPTCAVCFGLVHAQFTSVLSSFDKWWHFPNLKFGRILQQSRAGICEIKSSYSP